MKKKLIIGLTIFLFIICIAVLGWDFYVDEGTMNNSLELAVPLFNKKEKIELESKDFFNNEEVKKIYLSKGQGEKVLKNIEKNKDWVYGKLEEKIEEKIKLYTREDIYNQIPYIENKYWIFTNRSNQARDRHSIDETINDKYYAISLGIFDIDSNILYYYQYDR